MCDKQISFGLTLAPGFLSSFATAPPHTLERVLCPPKKLHFKVIFSMRKCLAFRCQMPSSLYRRSLYFVKHPSGSVTSPHLLRGLVWKYRDRGLVLSRILMGFAVPTLEFTFVVHIFLQMFQQHYVNFDSVVDAILPTKNNVHRFMTWFLGKDFLLMIFNCNTYTLCEQR